MIDGSSLLFRAYYALPQLSNSSGHPTGALHGMLSMLRGLQKQFPESLPVVVFDTSEPTFRHRLDPEYKANRDKMPEDLAAQITPIHQAIVALGLPLIRQPGYEADDIIATYCKQALATGREVLIVSGDKDLMQLVGGGVAMYDALKQARIEREQVFEKFGVWPEQIHDLLCLTGDAVDNIRGVDKVGPKTAAKWLSEHHTLNQLLANADAIKGKVGENLRASINRVEANRKLVALDAATPVEQPLSDLRQGAMDRDALKQLLLQFELKRHLDLLGESGSADAQPLAGQTIPTDLQRPRVELIDNHEQLREWTTAIRSAGAFAFDTETTGLDCLSDRIVGMALSLPDGRNGYIPCAHLNAERQIHLTEALQLLQPVFTDTRLRMVGQNLKFDLQMLSSAGVEPACAIEDTMLQSYVLNPSAGRHDLTSLAGRWLGYQPIELTSLLGKGKRMATFDTLDPTKAADYAGEDAWLAWQLSENMRPQLEATGRLAVVYEEMELPLVGVLARMETRGFLIDPDMLRNYGEELGSRMLELTRKAHQLAGRAFNLDSPRQLGEVLFNSLGLAPTRKTPKGEASTAEEVLHQLADAHPLPALMLDYRRLQKLKSTYTDALVEQVHATSGRVHSSFHQAVTATGRLSSSNPNLQNLPVKTEEGRRIRQAFIAPPGKRLVSADYSQIELRIMAHLSEDPGLLSAFAAGADIHAATAAEIFAAGSEVTSEQRRAAKAINFGLMYGMSAYGLARNLGISNAEAKGYIDHYFARYPRVQAFMQATREQVKADGYVETMFGRRLHLPGVHSKNAMQRAGAERAAINAPMQGSAADLIKKAMIEADRRWRDNDCALLLQVHDELVFEVAEDEVEDFSKELRNLMTEVAILKVPLVVDAGAGSNWLEAH